MRRKVERYNLVDIGTIEIKDHLGSDVSKDRFSISVNGQVILWASNLYEARRGVCIYVYQRSREFRDLAIASAGRMERLMLRLGLKGKRRVNSRNVNQLSAFLEH